MVSSIHRFLTFVNAMHKDATIGPCWLIPRIMQFWKAICLCGPTDVNKSGFSIWRKQSFHIALATNAMRVNHTERELIFRLYLVPSSWKVIQIFFALKLQYRNFWFKMNKNQLIKKSIIVQVYSVEEEKQIHPAPFSARVNVQKGTENEQHVLRSH